VTPGVRSRELAVAAAIVAALTAILTYPQILHLSSHVGTHYDALFSIWRLAWIAHQLVRDPLHLFDANIFYPEPNTLAYSDAMPLLGLIAAPAIWAGIQPVVVYNVLVLASFVTAGVAMYFLVRTLGASQTGACVAGIAFAFQPYRFAHYPQLELLWTCWIPLALWALHRAVDTRRVRFGLMLGLFVGLQAWSCLYYAVFLVTALAVIGVVVATGLHWRPLVALWKPAVVAVACACILIAPYAAPYLQNGGAVGARSVQDVQRWTPTLVNYVTAQSGNWLYGQPAPQIDLFEGILFPGIVTLVLALVGMFSGPRRWVIAYVVVVGLAFDLSLGFNGVLYRYFYEWVWPYAGLRVPARLFVIVSAGLCVLAAWGATLVGSGRAGGAGRAGGLDRARGTGEPRANGGATSSGSWVGPAAAYSLVLLMLVETVSIPLALDPVMTDMPRLYSWLARQPRAPVLEWPQPLPYALGLTQEPRYMYFSTVHWQPLVNGYSGHYPVSYIKFLENTGSFPEPDAIQYLRRVGVRYVILHSWPNQAKYVDVVQSIGANSGLTLQLVENLGSEEVAVYILK